MGADTDAPDSNPWCNGVVLMMNKRAAQGWVSDLIIRRARPMSVDAKRPFDEQGWGLTGAKTGRGGQQVSPLLLPQFRRRRNRKLFRENLDALRDFF